MAILLSIYLLLFTLFLLSAYLQWRINGLQKQMRYQQSLATSNFLAMVGLIVTLNEKEILTHEEVEGNTPTSTRSVGGSATAN